MQRHPFSLPHVGELLHPGFFSCGQDPFLVLREDPGEDEMSSGRENIMEFSQVRDEDISEEIGGNHVPVRFFGGAPLEKVGFIDVY